MMLPEYTYRVKTRMEKESKMTKEEVDKLGPLGLRLIEGLRGPALRIVQQLDVQVLGGTDGPKKILEVFHVLARRRKPGSSTQWEQEKVDQCHVNPPNLCRATLAAGEPGGQHFVAWMAP